MNINDHEDNFQFKKKGKLSESSLIMAASGGDFIPVVRSPPLHPRDGDLPGTSPS